LPRHYSRHAYTTAVGTAVARGGRVGAWLFDGVTESEQEAAEAAFEVNVKRDEARFARMAQNGPAGVIAGTR
jgi:hypothetical protein